MFFWISYFKNKGLSFGFESYYLPRCSWRYHYYLFLGSLSWYDRLYLANRHSRSASVGIRAFQIRFCWYQRKINLIMVSINSSYFVLELLFRVFHFVICWIECLLLHVLSFLLKVPKHLSILPFSNQSPKESYLVSPWKSLF